MEGKILELLKARHATRSISPETLPEQQVSYLLEASRFAPSCFNNQPWRFIVAVSEQARQKASKAFSEGNRAWAARAPVIVAAYSREEDDCRLGDGRKYHQFDLGMAVMNMMLAATELGLVARPMAGFDPAVIKEEFGLGEGDEPLVMLAIGKPSDEVDHLPDYAKDLANKPRERKPLEEISRLL